MAWWLAMILPAIGLVLCARLVLKVAAAVVRVSGRTAVGQYLGMVLGLGVCVALVQAIFTMLQF